MPRIMGRTVEVPAIVSLVAVLIGGVLLGIVGALVAIPVAAAIRLLLNEIVFHRLTRADPIPGRPARLSHAPVNALANPVFLV